MSELAACPDCNGTDFLCPDKPAYQFETSGWWVLRWFKRKASGWPATCLTCDRPVIMRASGVVIRLRTRSERNGGVQGQPGRPPKPSKELEEKPLAGMGRFLTPNAIAEEPSL